MLSNAIGEVKPQDTGAASAKRFAIETLTRLLSPLSPHIAEEIWALLGHDNMLADMEWPVANPDLARDDEIEIGIQVNGKLRDTITLPLDCAEEDARNKALASPAVGRYLDGTAPKKSLW